ncbi:DUF262 domain-containing protein [Vogesella amnigena]|uniref:DUF262 domain-containing protein n=1 Tax=Vogesella amnigena TaxID=1507449 RepID=A0ABV7TR82_9NEIS
MNRFDNDLNIAVLSLREVAAWQVESALTHQDSSDLVVSLPALQRSSVWKAPQVESLWDSIARGFPIGSLLLTPYQHKLGGQAMLLKSAPRQMPTHMLFDGQQRATSIALGFFQPWLSGIGEAPASLWLDIGASGNKECDFDFRLITRSHPWGYPMRGDRQRLETAEIRKAMQAFRDALPHIDWPSRCPPVAIAWPWDAIAPVPVAALITACQEGHIIDNLEEALDLVLPHWAKIQTRFGLLKDSLHVSLSAEATRGKLLRFQNAIERYRLPAQVVDIEETRPATSVHGDPFRPDPTETLFIRLNAGGTPLQGEDLIYSIIKAIWPDAAQMIDKIPYRFMTEARTAMLIARLALVKADSEGNEKSIPAAPDVTRFRRLIHMDNEHPQFRNRLENYLKTQAVPLFEQARLLLTESSNGLPTVLAADLARGESGREVMFLLLRWIERLKEYGLGIEKLNNPQRNQTIGALTAISWFSRRADRCVAALWPELESCSGERLAGFFNRKTMAKCFIPVRGEAPMPCLPTPELLDSQIRAQITQPSGNKGSFSKPESSFWQGWEWYERFAIPMVGELSRWYALSLPEALSTGNEEEADISSRSQSDWTFFADRLWGERRLVLYAQRDALQAWFPDFDPTDPNAMEEANRPWDIDHIHPRYFIEGRHNIPRIIRDWHGSIGNLRAWPLDVNRSDGEASPRLKLGSVSDEEKSSYKMHSAKEKRALSFISDDQWAYWLDSTPESNFLPRYLAESKSPFGECRKNLIRAITTRTSALYREWYDSLRIQHLMPSASGF